MKIKVILNKDIPRIGQKGQILELALNYAQNVILNKGLGVIATPQMIKKIEDLKSKKAESKILAADDAIGKLSNIEKTGLIIERKANQKGQLYAKVTEKDISQNIFETFKIEINNKQIVLDNVIEHHGQYNIKINLNQNGKTVKTFIVNLIVK